MKTFGWHKAKNNLTDSSRSQRESLKGTGGVELDGRLEGQRGFGASGRATLREGGQGYGLWPEEKEKGKKRPK